MIIEAHTAGLSLEMEYIDTPDSFTHWHVSEVPTSPEVSYALECDGDATRS
jgi:hypothetical protein